MDADGTLTIVSTRATDLTGMESTAHGALTMYYSPTFPARKTDLLLVPLPLPFGLRMHKAPVYWLCRDDSDVYETLIQLCCCREPASERMTLINSVADHPSAAIRSPPSHHSEESDEDVAEYESHDESERSCDTEFSSDDELSTV